MTKPTPEQAEAQWLAQLDAARRRNSAWGHLVEADYEVVDGVVREIVVPGAPGLRDYFPMATRAILGDFTRMRIGDESSLLKFARSWGLLGYDQLMQRDTPSREPHAGGDPVAWIWAHVAGVQTALGLWGLWRHEDMEGLAKFSRRHGTTERQWAMKRDASRLLKQRKFMQAQALVEADWANRGETNGEDPDAIDIVSADHLRIHYTVYPRLRSQGAEMAQAWNIVRNIINPNLSGVRPQLSPFASRSPGAPVFSQGWDSVMSVIYRHLFEIIASGQVGGQVEECRECMTPFIRTDGRQRFCPPPPSSRESQCAMRFHKREQRKRSRTEGPST